MRRSFWADILKFGMLVLSVSSVGQWLSFSIGPVVVWWLIYAVLIFGMVYLWDKSFHPISLVAWMMVITISCLYGTKFCRDYWDWKLLISNFIYYSMCLAIVVANTSDVLQDILRFLYKHLWKIFIILVLFLNSDGISKFLIPYTFLALLYPLLDNKYKKVVWGAFLITIILGYDGRSDILKFLFCILVGVFANRHDILPYIRKWYWIFYVLPVALFMLAVNGTFNVFKFGEELKPQEEQTGKIRTDDTRTVLYEEVLTTAEEQGTVYFGGTPARGYYSNWMIQNQESLYDIVGELHYGERSETESSVLNVFMHFGVFGLIIYMILFFRASYLGIFKSNNMYVPILGLYVAFRFFFGWVEDFTRFDLNMFFLWAMVGMCYSPFYREMTDDEFYDWFENILA